MFYNPLLDNLVNLTDQQLDQKLNELVRKYVAAQSIGNAGLQMQLSGVIEIYRNEIVERTNARFAKYSEQKPNKNDADPFSVVDIS